MKLTRTLLAAAIAAVLSLGLAPGPANAGADVQPGLYGNGYRIPGLIGKDGSGNVAPGVVLFDENGLPVAPASAASQTTTNTALGAPADSACASDNGTCAVIALLKRTAQRLTTVISTLGSPLQAGGNVAVTSLPATPAGTNGIGNVGGKTVSVCVTPTVTTANSYGVNYVIGGKLTFANAFTSAGSGILQSVAVTIKKVETSGFTFVPFNADPSNSTWTDAAVAAINAADVAAVREPVNLTAYSGLGTHTVAYAAGLGQAMAPGTTSLYGVLIANAALTNQFTSTSDVQVCVKVLQDL